MAEVYAGGETDTLPFVDGQRPFIPAPHPGELRRIPLLRLSEKSLANLWSADTNSLTLQNGPISRLVPAACKVVS
jgi:hypothetical protein